MSTENDKEKQSPRITHSSWGRMDVESIGSGRDFKLYPGGGRAWDWTETGTHHEPGIQPADVGELLDHGSKVVILSRGRLLALQTCPETLQILREGIRKTAAPQASAAISALRDAGNSSKSLRKQFSR